MSTSFQPASFLRYALIGDAAASGAAGLLLIGGAGFLGGMFGLPESLLRYVGLLLLPYAAVVAYIGTRATVTNGAIGAIIAVNIISVAACMLLLLSGWVQPNVLGTSFIIAQALIMVAFAEAQFIGLRRSRSTALAEA